MIKSKFDLKKDRLKILFFFLFFLYNCSTDIESRQFIVENIIDGNTIQLDVGITVHLIGIESTNSSFRFLQENVLSKSVKIKFDRQSREKIDSSEDDIYAYVTLRNGKAVNGTIIKQKLAKINYDYLTDSLTIFKKYADNVFPNTNQSRKIINSLPEETIQDKDNTGDLQNLVKQNEKAVFLINAYNRYGQSVSIGTGFFIKSNGLALSNYHVFEGGNSWDIKTINGDSFRVEEILYTDKQNDFIVYSVEGNNFPYLNLKEDLPEKGENIFVIGNPKGLESTLTTGIVSAIRSVNYEHDFIQIDAAISPGSSGSPVMDMTGKVVGIATQKRLDCENCNFAVSSNLILKYLNQWM